MLWNLCPESDYFQNFESHKNISHNEIVLSSDFNYAFNYVQWDF